MSSALNRTPNLFWRTFILLMFLIIFCVMGWLQSFRVLNETPYVRATAQQIISMANLTRYALISADPVYRPDLLLVLANREGLRILTKEPDDDVVPLTQGANSIEDIVQTVRDSLGQDTILAERVNDEPGLWVSFSIDGDAYWLRTNATILDPPYGKTWLWWALAAFIASILCAILITSRLTAPLNQLSVNAREFGRGRMPKALPEDSGPEELREVNSSFNRMVKDITRMEKDREVLIAGVSHDLRTPITRLRLETELADLPKETHEAMVSDLEQMEQIVNQFMDYARRDNVPLSALDFSKIVSEAIHVARLDIDPGVRLRVSIAPDVWVMGHAIELSRVVQNLITNALRYGKSEDGVLDLSITLTNSEDNKSAQLVVSDSGAGLDMRQADRLMRPFERGDAARGGTTGTGLGLAIVDRVVRRCSGTVQLSTTVPHGLTVTVKLPLGSAQEEKTSED